MAKLMVEPERDKQAQRGRPRKAGADEAILTASRALLIEHGLAGFSMDDVAQRAGIGRQSVYRRWPSKAALVVASMTWGNLAPDVFPDSGSFESDLDAALDELRQMYRESRIELLADFYSAMASDPLARRLFKEHWIEPRQKSLDLAVERAVERGELRPDTDATIIGDLIAGSFLFRRLIGDSELSDEFVASIHRAVMLLFGRPKPARRRPSRSRPR